MTKLGKCRRVFGESKDFTAVQQNTHADRDERRREKRTKNRFFIFVSQKRSFFLATPGNFRPRAPAIKKRERSAAGLCDHHQHHHNDGDDDDNPNTSAIKQQQSLRTISIALRS